MDNLTTIQTPNDLAKLNLYDSKYGLNVPLPIGSYKTYKSDLEEIKNNYSLDAEKEYIKRVVVRDFELLQEKIKLRNKIEVPSVGDYILTKEGDLKRIAINLSAFGCENEFQYGNIYGSYHLSNNGYSSYSGTCYERVNTTGYKLKEVKPASFWMWHNNSAGAHRSIQVVINVKVWEEI